MPKRSQWGLWLLIGLILLLAACDEVPANTPSSTSQAESILSGPTTTVKPIVSFTPRFTATPIPSATLTPSDTPIPTATGVPPTPTLTPTPSPTPTVEGAIRSTENVNLREGPGTEYPIVLSVSPGTEVGVLGRQEDARGRDWYKIAFAADDGEMQFVWVLGTLLETDYDTIIVQPPPTAAEALPDTTAVAGDATTPSGPTPEPERVEILAYCTQKNVRPPTPTTNDNVYIEWSWYVGQEDLMDDHLENANYEVRVDGELLDDWQRYEGDLIQEGGRWYVYWFYPVGKLGPGTHEVKFALTWDEAISDGYDQFGPGTLNEVDEGSCTFTVTEP